MLTFIDDENRRYFIHRFGEDDLPEKWIVSSCPFNQTLSAMTVYRTFPTHDDAVQWVREKILLEKELEKGVKFWHGDCQTD